MLCRGCGVVHVIEILRSALAAFLTTLLSAAAADVIGTIREVRSLPYAEALSGLPVSLEAVVIYSDPTCYGAVIDDGTAACYLSINSETKGIVQGARLKIHGSTTQFGLFPHLKSSDIKIVGKADLPKSQPLRADELFLPEMDSAWIQVPAVVTGVESGGIAYTLVVEVFGHEFKADLPPVPDADRRAAALMQRTVSMTAVAATVFNNQMQMTGRHFLVPSFDFLVPMAPTGGIADVPLCSTWELLRGASGPNRLVRLVGVVTQDDPKGFYLRDAAGSAFVQTAMTGRFPPGTRVEATGFGKVAPYRPILRATAVRLVDQGTPPPPRQLLLDEAGLSTLHDELITVDAEFLGLREGTNDNLLLCRAGNAFFETVFKSYQLPFVKELAMGDTLRLTGICKLFTTHPMPRPEWADGFRIHLDGPSSIRILDRAPWWTEKRLFSALWITGLICFVSLAVVAFLRHRVACQMQIIGGKLRDEAVHTERDRMARELHDTLEQQLAGVSLQIDGIARATESNPEAVESRVAVARRMIRHTRAEARRSVWDLRSRILENEGLPAALRAMAAAVSGTPGSPAVEVAVGENLPPLTKSVEFQLLRLAQEALTNAIKHSGASKVLIELLAADSSITLRITDEGMGFDSRSPSPEPAHFGMTGMHERAERIKANINIESSPGNGCIVTVTLPLDHEESPDIS